MMEISKKSRRLYKSEISQYEEEGYIKNLPEIGRAHV